MYRSTIVMMLLMLLVIVLFVKSGVIPKENVDSPCSSGEYYNSYDILPSKVTRM